MPWHTIFAGLALLLTPSPNWQFPTARPFPLLPQPIIINIRVCAHGRGILGFVLLLFRKK